MSTSFCAQAYKELTDNHKPSLENVEVCSMLIEDAIKENVPIDIVLAIAWTESRFTAQPKPNNSGCVGPLQIKVIYWCKNKKLSSCDTFNDGVKAVKHLLRRFKPINKAICFYNDSRKPKCKPKHNFKSEYVELFIKARTKINNVLDRNIIMTFIGV
jgi:hypothetical protein